MNNQHMIALRETMTLLRKVKADIEGTLEAMEDERTLLPERLWRSAVDDDAIETEVSVEDVAMGLQTAIESLATILGEDETLVEDTGPRYARLPDKLPSYEQVDAERRERARVLRSRR